MLPIFLYYIIRKLVRSMLFFPIRSPLLVDPPSPDVEYQLDPLCIIHVTYAIADALATPSDIKKMDISILETEDIGKSRSRSPFHRCQFPEAVVSASWVVAPLQLHSWITSGSGEFCETCRET